MIHIRSVIDAMTDGFHAGYRRAGRAVTAATRRPPVTWCTAINTWLADRLVRPWLGPLIRPVEHAAARRRLTDLQAMRALLAGRDGLDDAVARLDQAIRMCEARVADTAPRTGADR